MSCANCAARENRGKCGIHLLPSAERPRRFPGDTEWFSEALARGRFEIWFQPIVDTGREAEGRGRILAHECLIRLISGHLQSDADILNAARIRNQAFDSYARNLSMLSAARASAQNPSSLGKYFVDFMPSARNDLEVRMRSTLAALAESGLGRENIVFQVGQLHRVPDASHLHLIFDYFRRHGFALALDDIGSDANSLQLVCDLRPDYFKLHKSLVVRVEQPRHAAAVRKLVELAGRFEIVSIADGVERIRTLENLWLLGVECMQGVLFGRPAPHVHSLHATLSVRGGSGQADEASPF
jgi:EAL domain-containing protein (putative c-di-GMP-specific phosphodiesterase class I)